jgi:hypothetical protein
MGQTLSRGASFAGSATPKATFGSLGIISDAA